MYVKCYNAPSLPYLIRVFAHTKPLYCPLSAFATACGLGGGTVFVLPKLSRMGGTTTGSAMPKEKTNEKVGTRSVKINQWVTLRSDARGCGCGKRFRHP